MNVYKISLSYAYDLNVFNKTLFSWIRQRSVFIRSMSAFSKIVNLQIPKYKAFSI